MATLQARLMLVAFVAMAAAITYNATYLQQGPHPAPIASEKQTPPVRSKKAAREPRRVTKTLPQQDNRSRSQSRTQTVSAIQRKLAESGYNPGPADGVVGDLTRASIMAYQHDNALRVTGVASDRLLKYMILGASVGDNEQDRSEPVPSETTALVKAVQKTLTELGYDPGPVDGLLGSTTGKAIEKFERDRKLTATGRVSGHLVKELMQANGGSLSQIIAS